jgi:hypothetical protein
MATLSGCEQRIPHQPRMIIASGAMFPGDTIITADTTSGSIYRQVVLKRYAFDEKKAVVQTRIIPERGMRGDFIYYALDPRTGIGVRWHSGLQQDSASLAELVERRVNEQQLAIRLKGEYYL